MRPWNLMLLATCCAAWPGGPAHAAAGAAVLPTRYDLRVSVDPEGQRLSAHARILLTNGTSRPVPEITLLLYRLLAVSGLRCEERPCRYQQRVASLTDFEPFQVNVITVRLGAPLPPGQSTAVAVDYAGLLLGYAETGMAYIQDRIDADFALLRHDAFAYPVVAGPSLEAVRGAASASFDYRLSVDVPSPLVVANGGRLASRTPRPGGEVFVYESAAPSWRMDVAVGRYVLLEDGELRVFHLQEDAEGGRRVLAAARAAHRLFESWFGPAGRPGGLAVIEIPAGWGSQADVTTIVQSADAFRDAERLHEVLHEVAHLFDVPAGDRPPPRWNEGLATFLANLADEALTGRAVESPRAARTLARLQEGLASNPAWRTTPLARYGSAGMTDLSYSVGSLFFHLLHRQVGPVRFRALIAELRRRHGATGATTAQLADLARERLGPEVEPLLQDWLLTAGWTARIAAAPSLEGLEASSATSPPGGG
jgi:hypothetical protein